MEVHKDSMTIAIPPAGAKVPTRLERLPADRAEMKRLLDRLAPNAGSRR